VKVSGLRRSSRPACSNPNSSLRRPHELRSHYMER
jgi:hypothetical protein